MAASLNNREMSEQLTKTYDRFIIGDGNIQGSWKYKIECVILKFSLFSSDKQASFAVSVISSSVMFL